MREPHGGMARLACMKRLLLTTSLLFAACTTATDGPVRATAPPSPVTLDTDSVADASLDFGARMMETVRATADDPDETILISPASISTAFGLLYVGSEGDTQADIRKVMGFGPETDAFAAELGGLARAVERDVADPYIEDRRTIVDINNAVFLDDTLDYTPGYLDRVSAAYDADFESVSFLRDKNAAIDRINAWVKEKTRGLIETVYGYPDLSKETSDVLVNTIYMKAAWPGELSESVGPFTASGGSRDVPRVGNRAYYPHIDGNGFSALQIPFSDPELAAVAILPDRSLNRLERRFDSEAMIGLLDEFETLDRDDWTYVDFHMPKLSIKGSYKMRDQLQAMGMVVPFDKNRSDFDGRLDPANQPRRPNATGIAVGNVTHKTVLDLDEIGVEAAAVTAIDSVVVTGIRNYSEPVDFHVDRPFLFMLIHRPTGAPLFLARVTDPGEVD